MKQIIIVLVVLAALLGGYLFFWNKSEAPAVVPPSTTPDVTKVSDDNKTPLASTSPQNTEIATPDQKRTVLGSSVGGKEVLAYHYGKGDTEVVFVGGIHGGYAWNTVLVARELMAYLDKNPTVIPEGVRVTVIPVLNPDGLSKVVSTPDVFTGADVKKDDASRIAGRFNGNEVDLNRNFDCDWKSSGTWQNKTVSGGSAVLSEPETKAFASYIEKTKPDAVVAWYSAVGGVFSSNCHEGILPQTKTLTNLFAQASGYKAYEEFDYYALTGDMMNWLAKEKIPAISVLLTTHEGVEWEKNRKGVLAILSYLGQ